MQNNQFVQEYWKSNDCPNDAHFSKTLDTANLKRDKDGNIKCTLVILDYEYILENDIEYNDRDKIRQSIDQHRNSGEIAPPPDPNGDMKKYFSGLNQFLYSLMLTQIDETILELKSIL